MILVGLLEVLQNLLEGLRIEIIQPWLLAFQRSEFVRQLALWNTLLIFLVERLAPVQGPIPNESSRARHTQQFVTLKCGWLHAEFENLALLRHSFAFPVLFHDCQECSTTVETKYDSRDFNVRNSFRSVWEETISLPLVE